MCASRLWVLLLSLALGREYSASSTAGIAKHTSAASRWDSLSSRTGVVIFLDLKGIPVQGKTHYAIMAPYPAVQNSNRCVESKFQSVLACFQFKE